MIKEVEISTEPIVP